MRTGLRYDGERLLGRDDDLARLRSALASSRLVTVLGPGGIGKTSTTAGVGLALARYRGDRIIALDANPDAGDLYERTCPGTPPATLTDLAAHAGDVQSMTDLARFTGLAERLSVIAGDQDVEAGAVSFRFRDGTQENGVPVDDAVARVVEAVRSRSQV